MKNARLFSTLAASLTAALALGVTLWPQSGPAFGQPTKDIKAPASKEKNLYERLGGVDAIALVVDDFVNNLAANPVINGNAAVKTALGKVSVPGLKFKLIAQISDASGGPYKYFGRTMKEAHTGMKITEKEWDETVKLLKGSLDKFHVPSKEQSDLIGAIAPMHDDIVGH